MISLGKIGCRKLVSDVWENPYVTDGLVAMWDGEWNAGPGVHDSNATVWKDLIGERDLSLTNALFMPTSLHRDVSANGFLASDSGLFIIQATEFSVEICSRLEFSSLGILVSVPIIANGLSSHCGFKVRMTQNNYDQYGVGPTISSAHRTYQPPWPRNGIYGTITYTSTLDSYYNASEMVEDSSLAYPAGNIHSGGVALGNNSAYNVQGDIYAARVYSRALTAAEIAANYAIDKARFNLP